MSSRDYPSDYKIVRRQVTRDSDDDYVMVTPPQRRGTRDYDYSDDQQSQVSIASSRDSGARTTKTTYGVGRDRTGDAYVSQGRTVVLDSQTRRNREPRSGTPPEVVEYQVARSRPVREHDRMDYEVEKPRRGPDGYYVVESKRYDERDSTYTTPPSRKYRDYDKPRRSNSSVQDDEYSVRGPQSVDAASRYTAAPRPRPSGMISTRDAVRVEEYDDDGEFRRGRYYDGPPTRTARPRSILRHSSTDRDRSPETLSRRRSRSVSFREHDLDGHDVTMSRHERPGAEAAISGRYLSDGGPRKPTSDYGYNDERSYRREYDRDEDDRYQEYDRYRDQPVAARTKTYARRERYGGDTDDYGSVLEEYRSTDRHR